MQRTWLWPWLIWKLEILPYAKLFRGAAYFHDVAYERWGTESDRERADNMFLRLMLSVSKTTLQKWFAWLYYKLVRKYWKYFYNYNITYEVI